MQTAYHRITIKKCQIKNDKLIPTGEKEVLDIRDAIRKLAPSKSGKGIQNVVNAKSGHYIGLNSDGTNFVIVNPTDDGDIRWLIRKKPELLDNISELYLVDDMEIKRNFIDLSKKESGK